MFRSRVRTLLILVCLPLMISLHALGQFDPSQIMNAMQTRQPGLTLVASHRGEINGAYANNMPENSIGALRNAVNGGIEMVEADVWTTQDHVPYVMHDKTLGRTMGMLGKRSYYNPDPNGTPGVNWSAIQGQPLCAGRGDTNVANGGTGTCTLNYTPLQTVSSLVDFTNAVRLAQNQQGQPWGGVILLDLRDQDSLVQSWSTLVQLGFVSQQVVFKFSPLVMELNSVQDLVNLLATSTYYNGNTTQAAADVAAYMNFQPTYITNLAIKQETATGDPNWAIDDWNNWVANATSFHRLLSAEVSVKGSPGEFMTADTLYQTVTSGQRNTISVYSTFYECNDPNYTTPLPNLPPGAAGFNGYWINDGACNSLSPSTAESQDGIDHRYDYNFINGIYSDNTPFIQNPPDFGMIIADNSFVLINYLQGIGQRNTSPLRAHCPSSGPAYPGCDDTNNPGTSVYTLCATEGGTCIFSGDRNVAYGGISSDGQNHFNYKPITNSTACTTDVFSDPNPGYAKSCYISPPIPYVPGAYCGDEGQTCNFSGDGWPIIAANHHYMYKVDSTGYAIPAPNQFSCTTNYFSGYENGNGDPAPNFTKACFYEGREGYLVRHNGPTGYVFCSGEDDDGGCQFKGLGRVAYGRTPNFNYGVFNGGVACNNATFGDPKPTYTKDCYYQVVTPSNGATGTQVGGGGGGTSTCDIYASGGTPCVAAHSTVRALFGAYNGRLYQVKRSSDNTSIDIGTLNTGGFANAAAQDSFCAGSGVTCTITMIYDQTSNHNDMPIEGAGGSASPGADFGAVANALPISVSANNNVYGVLVTPGVGYRNNATTGVAKGNSPEGMYMVTSGKNYNSGCCFDYGNAEESMHDDGRGAMDALNFGSACILNESSPCNGPGPWVEVDLENGQWMGSGSNPGDVSMGYDFVTAMHKNNGTTTFALKGGNAQSGGLTTDYSGSLPPPYIQNMNLQGAIVLGTGGDNSNSGIGSFFEGAMTSGYPTDATEDAVQANIVSAGYQGDSGGGSGSNTGTYTGPSDPNGPGPQDGFGQPAAEEPNDIMGSKPALASFEGSLYVAFMGLNAGNNLFVASSQTGSNFPFATMYGNIQLGSAPALASFNGSLYVAFLGLNAGNNLFVTSSSSGVNFPTATMYSNIKMAGAPAMATFNNQLCLSFRGYNVGNTLYVTCSSDGVNWPAAGAVTNVQMGSDPSMTAFNGKLYVAFKSNNPSNSLWIASSSDGVTFTSQLLPNVSMGGSSSPALVVSNGVLYYIYGANDGGNEMLVMASTDGSTWQGPAAYLGVQMGATGPAAAAFGGGVSVGFQSNDPREVLYMTNKVTEASTYTGPSDPGGPGPQDRFGEPAIEEPNDVLGSRPALASFDGDLYLAFMGYNAGNNLFVAASSGGVNFPVATMQPNIQLGSAPTLASFNGSLYLAFLGYNAGNNLFVTSSSDGVNWPTATMQANIQMAGAPALAVFNNQLCLSFRGYNVDNTLFVTCSPDGVNWPTAVEVPNVQMGSDPTMAVFNGRLYIGFKSNDANNGVWIASSSDAIHFTSQVLPNISMGWESTPALVASNGVLYYIYGANDYANEMMVMASGDGSTWQGPAAYGDVQMGVAGLAAAAFGNGVAVDFQSNDGRRVLYTTNKITEASTYTGPSDPNGAGPQDGFASPAVEEPNDIMGSKPALASYNGSVYVAFMGLNAGNNLFVTSSSSGSNFPTATMFPNIKLGSAPALASFNGSLYLAFMGYNAGNNLFVTAASGFGFPAATIEPNIQMAGAPAMAVFNNQLCLSFRGLPASNTLYVTCSSDGVTWPTAWAVPNVQMGSDPAMATYNGKLYVAFKSNDANNGVWIASSSDGHTFTSQVLPNLSMGGNSAPALAVGQNTLTGGPGNALYYIYGADDLGNEMMVMASTDGSTWTGPAAFLGVQMGATGPGATTFDNGVSVGFQSNDSRNVLYTTFSSVSQLPTGPSQ